MEAKAVAFPRELRTAGWLARAASWPIAIPLAAGVILSSTLLGILLSLPSSADLSRYQIPAFFVVLTGCYVASVPIAVRSAVRSVAGIDGLVADEQTSLVGQLVRVPAGWLLPMLAIGSYAHVTILAFYDFDWGALRQPGTLPPLVLFGVVAGWAHILTFAVALAVLLRQGFVFFTYGRHLERVDLLDHRGVSPFVRASLRLALLNLFWFTAILIFHVDWDGDLALAPQMRSGLPASTGLTLALFLLPIWGVHQRLREEKIKELDRVHAALRGASHALRDSGIARDADGWTTVELLGYREHVAGLSTWPFDASTLLRLALYMGIPLLGWIGGALVERGLALVLD